LGANAFSSKNYERFKTLPAHQVLSIVHTGNFYQNAIRRCSMTEPKDSCVQPAKGPIGMPEAKGDSSTQTRNQKEEFKMIAKVGKPAPDFEASAFIEGGFKNIKLSDYKGKWLVLCFYPGDFTFV
jgi:hypothetical protein